MKSNKDEMFMTSADTIEFVNKLKIKKCNGFDKIPQRILIDVYDFLIDP